MKTCKTLGRISISVLLALVMLVSSFVGMITISAEETETEASASGITGISVSLSEDIIVNFKTTAETGDGSKVKVTFNEKEFEITQNTKGVFQFVNVTPQNMGDLITAQMYDKDGTTVVDEETFSVQSYLETLLSYEFGSEYCTCKSKLQHTALHELCVNMLNYGAAAQTYVNHDTENLANKNLTPEQQALATAPITVTESDKAVNGSAWVGAGVRFDYKLGLYFVFRAESATEYTATINGESAEIEAYPSAGADCYVIRYNGFNATNMNDVVTAKLTKDGADEQTFAYSVKSYVSSKGGDTSNIANLVNAMYTYGFAAVAYSAEYVEVKPTFETAGSLTMNGKGYDFSESVYGSVDLPVLSAANYNTETTNSGTETAPVISTSFILKHELWAYSLKFDATDCVNIDGILASEYDYTKFNNEKITVARDDTKGYTVTATDATLTALATYGAELTIKGTLTMDLTTPEGGTAPTWTLYKNTTLGDGTEDGKATVTVANAAGNGVVLSGADMLVAKNSSLTDNVMSLGTNTLTVDGTVTATTKIGTGNLLKADSNYETGYKVSIYIRSGKLTTGTIITNSMQIGSLMNGNVTKGHLVLTGTAAGENSTLIGYQNRMANKGHFYLAGQIDASAPATSRLLNIKAPGNTTYSCRIDVRKNMVINLGNNIEGFVYTNQNSNAYSYNVFWEEGAQLNKVDTEGVVTGQCENFFRVYQQNLYVYSWKEAEVLLGADATETTKVLIASRQEHTANSAYAKTSTVIVIPAVTEDTVITDTLTEAGETTTVNTAVLGTLTEATTSDGATVYYRVLG